MAEQEASQLPSDDYQNNFQDSKWEVSSSFSGITNWTHIIAKQSVHEELDEHGKLNKIEERFREAAQRYSYEILHPITGKRESMIDIRSLESMRDTFLNGNKIKGERDLVGEVNSAGIMKIDNIAIREKLGKSSVPILGWFVNKWRDYRSNRIAEMSNSGSEDWASDIESRMKIPDHTRSQVRELLSRMRTHRNANYFLYGAQISGEF